MGGVSDIGDVAWASEGQGAAGFIQSAPPLLLVSVMGGDRKGSDMIERQRGLIYSAPTLFGAGLRDGGGREGRHGRGAEGYINGASSFLGSNVGVAER